MRLVYTLRPRAESPRPDPRLLRNVRRTGVYTKCAVKMYKWDGQKDPGKDLQYEGQSPAYFLKHDLPENILCLNVIWGTKKGMEGRDQALR